MDRELGLIALHLTPGCTSLLRKELEHGAGSVERVLAIREPMASYNARTSYLVEQARINWAKAETILARFKDVGIEVISSTDVRYPARLKEVGSFPPLLYALGNIDLLKRHSVAICGSRHASPDGLRRASVFGRIAAESQFCVVSGYAQGVDRLAHLGALRASGCTVIILAEGILNFRVRRDLDSVERFWDKTLVISQFPPEQPWRVHTAMERNRVICGLARGLVVVEARESGGTIAAGRECLQQKKPLWVIEYSSPRDDCMGNTLLIREGGIGIQTVRDLRSALSGLGRQPLMESA